jgi:hypothetical protein
MLLARNARRLSAITLALTWLVLYFPPSFPAIAQTTQTAAQPQKPLEGADEDPTRAVFFSVREEYRNLTNGAWNNRLILRKDAAVLRGRRIARRGFLLRTDFPIATTHLGSETRTGLGDLYGQLFLIPHLTWKFALVAGTGILLPTATDKTLGTGKWQVAPLAVGVWYLPRTKGFFLLKVQEYISVAGVNDRPDINYLLVTPTLLYRLNNGWWTAADFESRTNWKNNNRTDFRAGFQVGKVINHKFGLAVKPEVPFGGTKLGDWTLKFSVIWYK